MKDKTFYYTSLFLQAALVIVMLWTLLLLAGCEMPQDEVPLTCAPGEVLANCADWETIEPCCVVAPDIWEDLPPPPPQISEGT